ncbi:MAG: hypothetical protein JWM86_45 [Thermoleophilia bacterium]|nr:hypothetical protein [Thermoleophilia bacterium]
MGGDEATGIWGNVRMQIPKGLLIAGGVGVAGAGLFFLNRDKKPEGGGAADASKDPAGAGAGKPGGATAPGAANPAAGAGLPAAGLPGAGTGAGAGSATGGLPGTNAGAGAGAGSTAADGSQQVGPYTLIPDPSGAQLVLETATQKPVGILDPQGNLTEITVDAQGNLVPVAGGLGTGTSPSAPAGIGAPQAGGIPQASQGLGATPQGGQWGSAQFAALSQQLFANAGNAGVGSASSDAMAGTSALSATSGAAPLTSNAIGANPQSAGLGSATGVKGASNAAPAASQLTVVQDPASGAQVVVDIATKQPVGVLDAQGQIVPIEAIAAQQQVAGTQPAIGAATTPVGAY